MDLPGYGRRQPSTDASRVAHSSVGAFRRFTGWAVETEQRTAARPDHALYRSFLEGAQWVKGQGFLAANSGAFATEKTLEEERGGADCSRRSGSQQTGH